jgi:hypothetical protein
MEIAASSVPASGVSYYRKMWDYSDIQKVSTCTREGHSFRFFFTINSNQLIKIGQYPSLADIALVDTVGLRNVLTTEQLKELNKAIGLAAHGVGVGSYVYLRRIFETLIEEAHQLAKTDKGWEEDAYTTSRMNEKIKLLAHHLPEFIVKNPKMYGLLSKGLHELTEEECLKNFEALKNAIFAIAEERLAELTRQKRIKDASIALKGITK